MASPGEALGVGVAWAVGAAAEGEAVAPVGDGAGSDEGTVSDGLACADGDAVAAGLGWSLDVALGTVEAPLWLGWALIVEQATSVMLTTISSRT